jgi:alpha-N-acetylglucosaminidase
MKFWVVLVVLGCQFFGQAQCVDCQTASALVERIAPQFAAQIQFKKEDAASDYYSLETQNGKVVITANSANSMAVGFNYFLKNYCHTAVSWYANDAVVLPAQLPIVPQKVRNQARVQNRFFLNYCTFGYTMPWWQWREWERFIDWMALSGVNLPLAITGQEKIWMTVWKEFGLSDEQIRSFFTGPAYLPWHRMANIDHWEGPLPQSWIEHQAKLQQQIVQRERALNMKPVLPAFAGHVPKALLDKNPQAKISSLGEWGNFSPQYQSYFLDAFDPLFAKIQSAYLKVQTQLYGTDHIYGIDPFNEVTPPSWEPSYLASASQNIYKTLTQVDKEAQWLQMGWIFYFNQNNWTNERIKAYLQAVPQDKMLLLDYFCDHTEIWKKTESFYGQPYIWCYLGNFGGNTTLHGNLKDVDVKIENALKNGGKNLWGIGSTLEGFGNNPILYEYVLDKVWETQLDYRTYANRYAQTRSGGQDPLAQEAWQLLVDAVYTAPSDVGKGDLTNSKPTFVNHFNWTVNPTLTYSNKDLLKAWELLLRSSANTPLFLNDLTVVGKQVLGNYFVQLRDEFTAAYKAKNKAQLHAKGRAMLELIHDIDQLLATNPHQTVGEWIEMAKVFGVNEAERKYFEQDARKILTVWGEQGHDLNDYANRSWAGLMKTYYGKRWEIFIEATEKALQTQTEVDEADVLQRVNRMSNDWSESQTLFSSKVQGSTKAISVQLYQKYASAIINSK